MRGATPSFSINEASKPGRGPTVPIPCGWRDKPSKRTRRSSLAPSAWPAFCWPPAKARKAAQAIERAWRRQPHPDLAEVYRAARPGANALEHLRALQHLAELNPDHAESHLAVAHAALEARLWGEARQHLEAVNGAAASATVCRLMAELEESEHGDTGRAREWLTRASVADPGPAWVCGDCGMVVAEWTALCPKCSSFDSLAWRHPPGAARLAAAAPVEAPAALPAVNGASG